MVRLLSLTITFSILLVYISCSNQSITGGTSTTGNSIITGLTLDINGNVKTGTIVTLLPIDFNPAIESALPDSLIDTTDHAGAFTFALSHSGTYNIQALHPTEETEFLFSDLSIQHGDTISDLFGVLKKPGFVKIFCADTIDTINGYLCFLGTTLFRNLDEAVSINDSAFEIDFPSVPAMRNSTISYGKRNGPTLSVTYAQAFDVISNDTVILDFLKWVNFTTQNSEILSDMINDVAYNKFNQTLWIATNSGICGIDKSKEAWFSYTKDNSPLPSNRVKSITAPETPTPSFGTLWFATDRGAACLKNGQWTLYTTSSGLPSNQVTSIAVHRKTGTWFSTMDAGCALLHESTWILYDTTHGLPSNTVLQIDTDNDGVTWCATNRGAARFDGNTWQPFTTENSAILSNTVFSVVIDKNAIVWFGCKDGVSRFDGNTWTNFTAQNTSPILNDTIHTVYLLPGTNTLFVGTSKGLTKFDGKEWFDYSGARYTKLENKQIRAVTFDLFRTMWAGTTVHGLIGSGFRIRED